MRGLKRLVYNVHIFHHQEPSKVLIPDTQHRCQLARSYGSSLYKQGLLCVSASGPFLLSIQTYSSLFLLSVLRAIPTSKNSSRFQVGECSTHSHFPTSMETVFAYKVFHFDRCNRLGFRFYPFFKLFHTRHTLGLLTRIVTQQVQTQKRNSSYAGFVRPPLSKKYWNTIPPAKHIKFVFGLPRSTKKKDMTAGHVFLFGFRSRWSLHPSVFQCSGQVNGPSAKVFAAGENACTAHQRRRPEGRLGGISVHSAKKTSSVRAAAPPFQLRPAIAGLAVGVPPCGRHISLLTETSIEAFFLGFAPVGRSTLRYFNARGK